MRVDFSSLGIHNAFGGPLLKNSNPKSSRPISLSKTNHFVLKTNSKLNLYKENRSRTIIKIFFNKASLFNVKILKLKIIGNTIHIFLKSKNKNMIFNFLRTSQGLIARSLLNAEKNNPSELKLWLFRPWSRILNETKETPLQKDSIVWSYLWSIDLLPKFSFRNSS